MTHAFYILICHQFIKLSHIFPVCVCVCVCVCVFSLSVMSDSLWPHGLTRLLCPWDSPGKNTEVGGHTLGDLLNPGIEPRSPALQADSLPSEPPGKPNFSLLSPKYNMPVRFYLNKQLGIAY